jgi:hypothetical protein
MNANLEENLEIEESNEKNSYKNCDSNLNILNHDEQTENCENTNLNLPPLEEVRIAGQGLSKKADNLIYDERNNFEKIVETLFNHFSSGLKIIGPFFAFALILFILTVTHTFFTVMLPYWKNKLGEYMGMILCIITCYIVFMILFNYLLSVLVKPGCAEDMRKSKIYTKEKNPYVFNEELLKEVDLNYLLSGLTIKDNDVEEISQNKQINSSSSKLKYCHYCKETKPLRSHHCQICGYCVFKMDHHCPWINNCVGQNNHRYFVLFLTHTFIGCIYMSLLNSPIFFFNKTSSLPATFNFVSILCLTGCVLLLFFCSWNWFLVLNGNTTIEFWSEKAGFKSDGSILTNFSFYSVKENIFMIFGTKNLIEAVFIPSIKKLPYSGLEWSRLCDSSYTLKGVDENYSSINNSDGTINFENDLLKDIEI